MKSACEGEDQLNTTLSQIIVHKSKWSCLVARKIEPRSLKSTTTQPAVGGPKTFWEDQRAWRPKNLAAQRAERTKVLRKRTTGRTKKYLTNRWDTEKLNTHFCHWLNLSKFTHFLGGPNRQKICGGRTKTDFKDRALIGVTSVIVTYITELRNMLYLL